MIKRVGKEGGKQLAETAVITLTKERKGSYNFKKMGEQAGKRRGKF